jgi:lipopolysaccharide/colanic/teichoic acid biosynthesis glycosyltransferase
MSFVGPRPLLVDYLKHYSPDQKRRHLVMPGITGWSQVNGRNSISWQQKFEMDSWYVDHQSFLIDLKILVMTVAKVLRTSEVNASASETMSPFTGNN